MKTTPVSGDLLLKIGLAVAAIATLAWAARRVGGAAGQAASNAAWAVSPTNNNNVIYRAANWATGGSSDTSLGSRIYDWTHPSTVPAPTPYVIPQDFGITDPNAGW